MTENVNGVLVETVPQPKVRTWGGWYRHYEIRIGDVNAPDGMRTIGRVQERVRPGSKGRRDYLTCHDASKSCVLGRDVAWVLRVEGIGSGR